MIVVDSSALVAILDDEDDLTLYAGAIAAADRLCMSAVNVHETGIVLRMRRGPDAVANLWRFLSGNGFEIVPFDTAQVRAALTAFERFGKGLHPRARLNLADCAASALATTLEAPLLFKGNDFAATDILPCL